MSNDILLPGEFDEWRHVPKADSWPRIYHAADIDHWPSEPVEWLVEDMIPRGALGYISAYPKAKKSLLLDDLALHLSHAFYEPTFWLGRFRCRASSTLIVAREDPLRRVKGRLEEMMKGLGWADDYRALGLYVVAQPRFDLMNPGHREWLLRTARDVGAEVLILDPLSRIIPGVDENSAQEMSRVVEYIEELNFALKATIIIVDHSRKPPKEGEIYGIAPSPHDNRGSGVKYGSAEFMICLAPQTSDGRRIRVRAESKDSEVMDFTLEVSPLGCTDRPKFIYAGSNEDLMSQRKATGAANRTNVLSVFKRGEALRKDEVCRRTGLRSTAAGAHLKKLTESGHLVPQGENINRRYSLADRSTH
jgi:hypothetical protein